MADLRVVTGEKVQIGTPQTRTVGLARAQNVALQPDGGYLQQGREVGHPGAGGRPTEEYKAWCRAAAMNPAVRDRIEKELVESQVFPVKLWETLMERGFGKIPQAVVQDAAITIKVQHE